jgi:ankyrin repeat protein
MEQILNAPPSMDCGRIALQAAYSIKAPRIELVKLLLDKGADVNVPASLKQELTVLQDAAIQGHIKTALMFPDAGVEVNVEPAAIDERTSLNGAAEHGVWIWCNCYSILEQRVKILERRGLTRFAEKYGHPAVVDLLKDHSQKD